MQTTDETSEAVTRIHVARHALEQEVLTLLGKLDRAEVLMIGGESALQHLRALTQASASAQAEFRARCQADAA